MKKYMLLASQGSFAEKENLSVIRTSDNIEELTEVWKKIIELYLQIEKTNGLLEKNSYLNMLFGTYEEHIIWKLEMIGIVEIIETAN